MNIINKIISKINNKIKKIDIFDILIFLIPVIIFSIYLIICYPGILSYDSYNQIGQMQTGVFVNSHPFFHTFCEMILLKIWNSAAMICIFQILVFSIIWTCICKYNRKNKNVKVFLFQIFLTILICLNPLNGVLAITLWKDVLYSYMILLFCFLLQKAIDKKFCLKKLNIISLAFVLILLPNLRHNGLLITIIMGIILTIILLKKDKKSFNYIWLLVFMLTFFLSFKMLNKIYKVVDSPVPFSQYITSKSLMAVGSIGNNTILSEDELKSIDKFIDTNKLLEKFGYNDVDTVLFECDYNHKKIESNKKEFYSSVINIYLNHKKEFIKFVLNETAFVWKLKRLPYVKGIVTSLRFYSSNSFEGYSQINTNSKSFTVMEKIVYFTRTDNFMRVLCYSGALYLYFSLIFYLSSILFVNKKQDKQKNKYLLLLLLPMIINLLGLILTIPSNDIRYYYCNMLTSYIIINIVYSQNILEKKTLQ